jgi:hypothetical protein
MTLAAPHTIEKIVVTMHTSRDDKDKGDSVALEITDRTGRVIARRKMLKKKTLDDWTAKTWAFDSRKHGLMTSFEGSGCDGMKLHVSKSGDKGWALGLEVHGFTKNGDQYLLLPRTPDVLLGHRTNVTVDLSKDPRDIIAVAQEHGARAYTFPFTCGK